MNRIQQKINDFQVELDLEVQRVSDPELLEALREADQALDAAFLAAFNLDRVEV